MRGLTEKAKMVVRTVHCPCRHHREAGQRQDGPNDLSPLVPRVNPLIRSVAARLLRRPALTAKVGDERFSPEQPGVRNFSIKNRGR